MRRTVPLGTVCPKCEQVHERCAAHNRRGGPCRQWHKPGLEVCEDHGAKGPRAVAVTERFLANREAEACLADVVVLPVADPLTELAHVAAESRAWQQHVATKLAELDEYTALTPKGFEYTKALVGLYERSMDRSARFLADWVRLGFDERMVALHERQADLVDRFVGLVLDDLDLNETQTERAAEAKVRHLHVLTEAA